MTQAHTPEQRAARIVRSYESRSPENIAKEIRAAENAALDRASAEILSQSQGIPGLMGATARLAAATVRSLKSRAPKRAKKGKL